MHDADLGASNHDVATMQADAVNLSSKASRDQRALGERPDWS
jgi:hypothetical protein